LTKAFAFAAVLAALILAAAACGRSAPWSTKAGGPTASADASNSGYREPPQVRRAARDPDGAVVFSGVALPGASVRLASPDGRQAGAVADSAGAWSLAAPPGGPAIYGLSQEAGGRRDQAQGYLAVLPYGEPAGAELRSGAGAVSLAPATGKPTIAAIDFDGTGAAVVSGWALANQPLRVLVDGVSVDEGAAGRDGRFFLSLPKPLASGLRKLQIAGPDGGTEVSIDIGPAPAFAGVMRASRHGSSWRLDWITPSGGVQSTVLFSLQEPGR
jgi:hypothetical protein